MEEYIIQSLIAVIVLWHLRNIKLRNLAKEEEGSFGLVGIYVYLFIEQFLSTFCCIRHYLGH